jgi:heme exporter protein B
MLPLILKDLRIELRTKETVTSLLMLGLLILLVLSFAFDPTSRLRGAAAPGVLWVAVIFAGVLGINRSLVRESEQQCMQGLLLAPIDRGTIFLAKTISNFIVVLVAECFVLLIFILFFNLPFWITIVSLAPILLLGLLGFAAIGTLFAAISLRTRAREVMLPLLMLPLATPLFLSCVQATSLLLAGQPLSAAARWIHLLIAFDVIFLVVGWLGFEYVVEE